MTSMLVFFPIIWIALPAVLCQCPEKNGRFALGRQCDGYLECRDGTPRELTCPDGLAFNDLKTKLNRYPCDYLPEVDCGSRTDIQAANPTEHCPRQFGLYSHEDKRNCGQFWNCVDGRSFLFDCPEGLAFSSLTIRCEWPDETPDCDPEEFLGFRCPAPDPLLMEAFLNNPRYAHPSDCRKFYVCIDGTKPRLLQCQQGFAYDDSLKACTDPQNVPGCTLPS